MTYESTVANGVCDFLQYHIMCWEKIVQDLANLVMPKADSSPNRYQQCLSVADVIIKAIHVEFLGM